MTEFQAPKGVPDYLPPESAQFVAVRDGSPRLLRQVLPDPDAESGRGLWLVEQLARSWGVRPHRDGGKVVWCTLNL